ncbi:hypothetical protein GCM10023319_67610 [Nocardia iowensis]
MTFQPSAVSWFAVFAARPTIKLLFSTRTGTDLAAAAAVVLGGGVVVGGVVVDDDGAGVVAGTCAGVVGFATGVLAGACGAGVVDAEGPFPELSASDFDSDIAPSPPNTMASAINTIANARNGGPPEVGFG